MMRIDKPWKLKKVVAPMLTGGNERERAAARLATDRAAAVLARPVELEAVLAVYNEFANRMNANARS